MTDEIYVEDSIWDLFASGALDKAGFLTQKMQKEIMDWAIRWSKNLQGSVSFIVKEDQVMIVDPHKKSITTGTLNELKGVGKGRAG